uniref:Uncharacterized protein n=1 Tax=Globisporangium ultimum (strain ATCC 200006 / CBS 805.95 / DAOM BR144) TaxID=431595 RepID=K3WRB4_GLOUD
MAENVKHSIPILKSAAVTCLLFGLGIRDAIYKAIWISPSSCIRQNCKNVVDVAKQLSSGCILLTSRTAVNFSSFGQMYLALILIDVTLLVLHFLSSMEIFTWMLLPEAQELRNRIQQSISRAASHFKALLVSNQSTRNLSTSSTGLLQISEPPVFELEGLLEENLFYSFFSRSLYRSPTVTVGTFTTQLISWLLVLPNSVVWTWSDSWSEKLQVYLSSIRTWVLILLLTNMLWNGVVLVNKEWAYRFVKGTFVSSLKILVVGALMSFTLRVGVFAMCERNLEQDYLVVTPTDVLWIIYAPLLRILAWSIVVFMLYATLKSLWPRLLRRSFHAHTFHHLACRLSPQHKVDDVYTAKHDNRPSHQTARKYERSQIEQILSCPVRTKSLIRNTLQMATVDASGRVHISPSCYLDFGVMMRDGDVRSRICFSNMLVKARRPENDLSVALEDHPSNVRRRSTVARVTMFSGQSAMRRRSDVGV